VAVAVFGPVTSTTNLFYINDLSLGVYTRTTTNPLKVAVAAIPKRSVVKFAFPGSIPAGAIITKVELSGEIVTYPGTTPDVEVVSMLNNFDVTDSDEDLYNYIDAGYAHYIWTPAGVGAFNTDLGVDFVFDAQTGLDSAVAHWLIGMKIQSGDTGTVDFARATGLTLTVTYVVPGLGGSDLLQKVF